MILFRAKNGKELMLTILGYILAGVIFAGIIGVLIFFLNKPLVLTIGEREIKPGETRLEELLEDGFTLSPNQFSPYAMNTPMDMEKKFYSPELEVKDNSHWTGIQLIKDGTPSVSVDVSTYDKTLQLKDCFIEKITLYEPLLDTESCYIDGIPAEEATVEKIIEKRGDYKEQSAPDSDGMTKTLWTKGSYHLTVQLNSSEKIVEITAEDKRVFKW